MARLSLKGREFTFYFPSIEDKARWKSLAKPLTLNRWIFLMVEKALEGAPNLAVRSTSDDINAIRREVVILRQENTVLAARLDRSQRDLADLRSSKDSLPLEKSILDLIKLFVSGGTWTSSEILSAVKMTVENEALRAKAIGKSLELLEDSDLVEKTQTGWRLNKHD
jgi:hypothetical protein